MIVAITGNIGSGKSTAAELFVKAGYKLINADIIGHELYSTKSIKDKVVKNFGKGILTDNKVDRRKLKDIVFYNKKKLQELNEIMHPGIVRELNNQIKAIQRKNKDANIIIEAALIIEFGFKNYDKLVLITVDRKEQVKRLLKKGKYTLTEIKNIINSQMPQEKKKKYTDIVLDNSGTKKEFEVDIKVLIKELE